MAEKKKNTYNDWIPKGHDFPTGDSVIQPNTDKWSGTFSPVIEKDKKAKKEKD